MKEMNSADRQRGGGHRQTAGFRSARRTFAGSCLSAFLRAALLLSGFAGILSARQNARIDATQYVHQVWGTHEGLPQTSISSVVQAQDGYIWMGTRSGLVRFDGASFTVFDTKNTRGLLSNEIMSLAAARDGSIWAATSTGGMSRIMNGVATTFSDSNGLGADEVWAVFEDRDGTIWVGTSGGGVDAIRNGIITNYGTSSGLSNPFVWTFTQDRSGAVWVGTDGGGVNRIVGSKVTPVVSDAIGADAYVLASYTDREGNVWFSVADTGVVVYRNGSFRAFGVKDGLPARIVWAFHEDAAGTLWVGTDYGLCRLVKEGRWRFEPETLIPQTTISSICEDREGDLWIATRGDGLHQIHPASAKTFGRPEGLSHDHVNSVYQDKAGTIWIGTTGGGLNRYQGGRIRPVSGLGGTNVDVGMSVYGDSDGTVWYGTDGAGLFALRGTRIRRYMTTEGLPGNTISTLLADKSGNLWIGADRGGLSVMRNGHFKTIPGIAGEFFAAIAEGPDGTIWVGLDDAAGLYAVTPNGVRHYTAADGLLDDIVRSLFVDSSGVVWIGTSRGLTRKSKDGFRTFSEAQGLFGGQIFGIVDDRLGNLWMSGDHGIFRIPQKDLDDVAAGIRPAVTVRKFGTTEGMRSTECATGSPAAWRAIDGSLWFATVKGVVRIDPVHLHFNETAPPVIVEHIIADRTDFPGGTEVVVPPGEGRLSVRYTALSYVSPENVRFRYMLEGFDRSWVDAGPRREAFYTNLSPGRYLFRVIACNNDGLWNMAGDSVSIDIRPHFYQTAWFTALMVVLVVGAGFGAVQWRERALIKRKRELTQKVEEAMSEIKVLGGLIPICANCKKIRDDKGYWTHLESYIRDHSEATFSHGLCPECAADFYKEHLQTHKSRKTGGDSPAPPERDGGRKDS